MSKSGRRNSSKKITSRASTKRTLRTTNKEVARTATLAVEWYAANGVLSSQLGVIRGVSLPLDPGMYELRLGYSLEESSNEKEEQRVLVVESFELYRDGEAEPIEGPAGFEVYRAYVDKVPVWLIGGV